MTHGERSYLLKAPVKSLDWRNFRLLFDIDFSDTALHWFGYTCSVSCIINFRTVPSLPLLIQQVANH
jgi:hypothetical protein